MYCAVIIFRFGFRDIQQDVALILSSSSLQTQNYHRISVPWDPWLVFDEARRFLCSWSLVGIGDSAGFSLIIILSRKG